LLADEVKRDALEEAPKVGEAIAAPFDDLEFVVDPLDEAAGLPGNEVVRNQLTPGRQGRQKAGKAIQPAGRDLVLPRRQLGEPVLTRGRRLKNPGEVLPQVVGGF